ncbi:cell division protein ZapA [Weeksellaceae bacterium KMM 9713]|uniref:Cell division protein ZapA n=1 Tax=Profundicola chukchiensis TaxID=2961959 RepID=A0A9X4N1E7_9FLAO|nr:cell division protein ZapA [Profundicola chukchiensis]MDG4946901.1 cell division protein ZapA [Profundicola chukchiensis]MDG4951393.1 cell division protein ZapA [Profundicola chukchiensis]
MADKVKLKITIAGRQYPMSVKAEEEEIIRKAGKQINELIKDFEQKYDIRDKQDALAMCSLQYVSKTIGLEKSEVDGEEKTQKRLRKIIDELQQQF